MSSDLNDADAGAGVLQDAPGPASAAEPPEVRAPLAALAGETPQAPAWFTAAIADEPERRFITSGGTQVELLTWGEVGKPGLLLLHGSGAHADWWSFIAPMLAGDFRVAALSWPGMGNSDWRPHYGSAQLVDDAEACARAAGLYESGAPPTYVGHSFGGRMILHQVLRHPERLDRGILIDTGFGAPPQYAIDRRARLAQIKTLPPEKRPARVFATEADALARFRLIPAQPATNLYCIDFIARRALKRVPLADGSAEGFMWNFDPDLFEKFDGPPGSSPIKAGDDLARPLAYIYGAQSSMVARCHPREAPLPAGTPLIEIPDAHHHIMLDQPLALVAALRTLLAVWPASASRPA